MTPPAEVQPICYINGKRYDLPLGRGEITLLQFLRESGLTGTKLGCGEGGCGACTVMVSSWEDGGIVHQSVNACLCPLYAVEGMHVVTVEGIGNVRLGLHPVQQRLSQSHGSQCGFCTPGFVMSMYSLLRSTKSPPTEEDIEDALGGNLCRCTGYRPILDAFRVFAKTDPAAYSEEAIAASKGITLEAEGVAPAKSAEGGEGKMICPSSGLPCDCKKPVNGEAGCGSGGCGAKGCKAGGCTPAKPTAEPIFPRELKNRVPQPLTIPGPALTWHRPVTLDALLELKKQFPEARLVVGNTEVGIEQKFKFAGYKVLVSPKYIPELNKFEVTEAGINIGAAVTLSKMGRAFKELIASRPAHETSALKAIVQQLRWFAGNQIRNVSALGGNIMTASPISDLNPLWMAAGAVFVMVGSGTGERKVPATEFFLAYRKVDAQPHEILLRVELPWTRQFEFVKEFKQAPRREDDIAIVNAGMRVKLAPGTGGSWVVEEAAVAYGGVAAKTIMAPGVAAALQGKTWDRATIEAALAVLPTDVALSDTAPGGKIEYRKSLTASFLFKFFLQVSAALEAVGEGTTPILKPEEKSAVQEYHRPAANGVVFMTEADPQKVLGQPYRHMAADLQVSGEAQYTDDVPLPPNQLHAALVMSTKAHANLLKVDPAPALAMPGVAGFFAAKDVPGHNDIGAIMKDEEVFATREVTCVGQVIGVVVADSQAIALAAARAVVIEYEELPALYSCEDAIEANSFYEAYTPTGKIECGDVEAAWEKCDHVIEGVVKVGGQEHFYLEPQTCIVVPQENDEFLIISSTQAPAHNQEAVVHALGVPASKVVSKSKRLGGGFGGKESRPCFLHAAIAVPAYHLRRPVRIVLDRDVDMAITGQRHPFLGKYKAGFTKEGKILAIDTQLYCNAGNSWDLSSGIADRALLHSDASYKVPNMRVTAKMCKTNLPSNTAYRGFGGPQGMMVTDSIIERISTMLGVPDWEVRARNLYKEGETTHFGQLLEHCRAQACFDTATKQAELTARAEAVDKFNQENRYRKRGLAVLPTKFGIAFTAGWLNQGGALVHIYTDGTVLVTHGGVEMGQGLHTKCAMVAAQELGISMDQVFISETSTDKVPNASPTAASASSDLYGAAVQDACSQLRERLAPFREQLGPDASFKDVAFAAWRERVDLSAHGFYKTPDVGGFGSTRPFNYFCYGCAVAEVELDTLTGDFHLLRANVVMDVGNPINPAIDIGQVEGGFVQGMGWACIEELMWGDKEHLWIRPGQLFTRGPGTYKIPTANDIPIDFRTTLLQKAPNVRAVHSSKAVGEPPFHLGCSVLFALKQAVYAARKDAGHKDWFPLDLPATPERLRMLCADALTAPYASPDIRPKISC